jgi:hypothetical protein
VGYWVPGICAGFLYQTDSKLALVENIVSAPDSPRDLRRSALNAVLDALCEQARCRGFKVVCGFSEKVPAVKLALRNKFVEADGSFTLLTRSCEWR